MTLTCTLSIIINAQELWVYLMAALVKLMRNCLGVKNSEKLANLLYCFSCLLFSEILEPTLLALHAIPMNSNGLGFSYTLISHGL